jgi:hypothetical protein
VIFFGFALVRTFIFFSYKEAGLSAQHIIKINSYKLSLQIISGYQQGHALNFPKVQLNLLGKTTKKKVKNK